MEVGTHLGVVLQDFDVGLLNHLTKFLKEHKVLLKHLDGVRSVTWLEVQRAAASRTQPGSSSTQAGGGARLARLS